MKHNSTEKLKYSAPEVVFVEVVIEMGFARSSESEDVGKDDEIEF